MKRFSVPIAVVLIGLCGLRGNGPTKPERIKGDVVPGAEWQVAAPELVGYSSAKLEALRAWLYGDVGDDREFLLRRPVQVNLRHTA